MNDFRESALGYVRRGWAVTPIRPREKRPALRNWPVVSQRFGEANVDLIWGENPEGNVGLLTGLSFDVLDIDGPDGLRSLRSYLTPDAYEHPGPIVQTGSGGYHLYFAPTGEANRGHLLPKVDYRGVGGQVVAPPSIHPNGTPYRWLAGHGPDAPLPEATDWLRALLRQTAVPDPAPRSRAGDHERGDVVAAFHDKGLSLRRDGPNRYKVHCYTGLHSDSDASLTIYTVSNSWYCHGCQSSGDAGNVKDGSYVRQGKRYTTA